MNYSPLCEKVLLTVQEASRFIQQESGKFDPERIEYKGFNDLVSYVDKQAEQLLVERLSSLLPRAGFITEEETSVTKGTEFTWIIDPLDGTTNFIHGLPVYSVSVALYHEDLPVIGVVHEISRDELFYASKGTGAFLNGKAIKVSSNPTLSASLLATGFPYYEFDRLPEYINLLSRLMKECHGIRRMGSAAVDLAYTACGRFDGFFEYNLNSWDVAGGAFIVQEAGGQVTDFSGSAGFIENRQILAANGRITAEMLQVIKETFRA